MAFMPSLTREARETLLNMLEKGELTDLTVKGSDSETGHRIHAIVLASVSSKFQDQLSPGNTITFPFPDEVLKAIIGIAYHGNVEEDFLDKWLKEAISVSLLYQVIELQEASRNHLYRKVNVENMLEIWSLSKRLGNSCEERIVKFVSRNVKDLALEVITNISYSDFRHLMSNSHLNLRREAAEELFKQWIFSVIFGVTPIILFEYIMIRGEVNKWVFTHFLTFASLFLRLSTVYSNKIHKYHRISVSCH